MDEYLKILIDKNVAAIAIKNVHHCQISDRTIDYANQHHIPIFQFSDTFIDDLIYIIKNALITNDLNKLRIDKLQGIMNAQNDADVKNLASELNPFFKENCICCCGIPKSEDNPEKAVDSFYEFYNQLVNSQHSAANVTHLLVKGKKCFFLIHSSDSNPSALKNELLHLIADLEISEKDFCLGLSSPKLELALHHALWEALYSAVTCIIDNETCLDYQNIGINQFLMPVADSDWIKGFYSKFNNRLEKYDRDHNSNLHQTLVQYIKCGGDITLVADRLYQHSNTIRYRLAKIKDVLEIKDKIEADIQMYVYVRLFDIYQNLKPDNLI